MRKKLLRSIAVVAALALILMMSFGCKTAPAADTEATAAAETTAAVTTASAAETTAAETTSGEPVSMTMWWWGEQEFVGLQGWVDETVKIFQDEHPNVTIVTTLQATENVFSDFPTASAAGNPPDLQYMWNGVYCMDWAWQGHVEPLNEYFTDEELETMYSLPLTSYEGKAYRVGWYSFAFGWAYNKSVLKECGVESEPKTWDEWLNACEKIKAKGYIPISLGSKDKLVGDWLQAVFGYQQLDTYADVLRLSTGELRWDNPKYYEHWVRIKELWDKGYINSDVNSLDLYQGQEMLSSGKSAFTLAVGSIIPTIEKAIGVGNVGYMTTPAFGVGKLAGTPTMDVQGIGIASGSANKELAAEFLRLMHRKDRLDAIYKLGGFPADKSFDASQVEGDVYKTMWDMIQNGIVYMSDVVPYAVTDGAANSGCQQLFAGQATPEDLGKEAQRLLEEWASQNPDMLENYVNWMK